MYTDRSWDILSGTRPQQEGFVEFGVNDGSKHSNEGHGVPSAQPLQHRPEDCKWPRIQHSNHSCEQTRPAAERSPARTPHTTPRCERNRCSATTAVPVRLVPGKPDDLARPTLLSREPEHPRRAAWRESCFFCLSTELLHFYPLSLTVVFAAMSAFPLCNPSMYHFAFLSCCFVRTHTYSRPHLHDSKQDLGGV